MLGFVLMIIFGVLSVSIQSPAFKGNNGCLIFSSSSSTTRSPALQVQTRKINPCCMNCTLQRIRLSTCSSVCLSVCLPVCLPVCLSVSLSVQLTLSFCLFICLLIFLLLRVPQCICAHPCLYLTAYVSQYICLCMYPPECLSLRMSVCVYVCVYLHLCVHLSVCLSIRLSICLSVSHRTELLVLSHTNAASATVACKVFLPPYPLSSLSFAF